MKRLFLRTAALIGLAAAALAGSPGAQGAVATDPVSDSPVVGMASLPSGQGYWEVASDGGVFALGHAQFFGSMAGTQLAAPMVGMAATPSGGGYWLVAGDGGVFAYGDARFFGSMAGTQLAAPMVGMAATPSGGGYWLVAGDGGVFALGDAPYLGSMAGSPLNQPMVGIAATPSGQGYWLDAGDGGVFAYGDAPFLGSLIGIPLEGAIVGIDATPTGQGYWQAASDGGMYALGDAIYWGRVFAPGTSPGPTGAIDGVDVSKYQGDIDWGAVAGSGREFAYVQASDGLDAPNAFFDGQFAGAQEAELLVGAYTYARFDESATAQAQLLIDMAGYTLETEFLPPMIDLESQIDSDTGEECGTDSSGISGWIHEYSDVVIAATGKTPVLYASPSWWAECMAGSSEFSSEYLLWVAHYGVDEPSLFGGWSKYTFWQTGQAPVPGVAGPVDVNVFNGTFEELVALTAVAPGKPVFRFSPRRDWPFSTHP